VTVEQLPKLAPHLLLRPAVPLSNEVGQFIHCTFKGNLMSSALDDQVAKTVKPDQESGSVYAVVYHFCALPRTSSMFVLRVATPRARLSR
jgi:hypothetical protein